MITESTFAAALDSDPTDWQTRLVFADWLLDRGDMRWEGMRWLGMARKWPMYGWLGAGWDWFFGNESMNNYRVSQASCLMVNESDIIRKKLYKRFSTRRAAENAFCRAFPALAAAHPAEFSVGVMV